MRDRRGRLARSTKRTPPRGTGLFLDGAAPPPGYGLRHFSALIDRYGEVLRAAELEAPIHARPFSTMSAPHAPGALCGVWRRRRRGFAAVADVLTACMKTPAACEARLRGL